MAENKWQKSAHFLVLVCCYSFAVTRLPLLCTVGQNQFFPFPIGQNRFFPFPACFLQVFSLSYILAGEFFPLHVRLPTKFSPYMDDFGHTFSLKFVCSFAMSRLPAVVCCLPFAVCRLLLLVCRLLLLVCRLPFALISEDE